MHRRTFPLAMTAAARAFAQQSRKPAETYTHAQVVSKVKHLIAEQLGYTDAKIMDAARLVDDLGADSLDIVEVVMALEEGFDIEISDTDCKSIATVSHSVAVVERELRAQKRLSETPAKK